MGVEAKEKVSVFRAKESFLSFFSRFFSQRRETIVDNPPYRLLVSEQSDHQYQDDEEEDWWKHVLKKPTRERERKR